jgi:hypothetical protein
MAKKPNIGSMKRQMKEEKTEPAGKALIRERLATILSEEIAKADEGAPIVLTCGNRGLAMSLCHEPDNYRDHVIMLTKAVAGMHRAIELAQRYGEMANWFESDLNAALAGAELVSNLAAEYAMLIPE